MDPPSHDNDNNYSQSAYSRPSSIHIRGPRDSISSAVTISSQTTVTAGSYNPTPPTRSVTRNMQTHQQQNMQDSSQYHQPNPVSSGQNLEVRVDQSMRSRAYSAPERWNADATASSGRAYPPPQTLGVNPAAHPAGQAVERTVPTPNQAPSDRQNRHHPRPSMSQQQHMPQRDANRPPQPVHPSQQLHQHQPTYPAYSPSPMRTPSPQTAYDSAGSQQHVPLQYHPVQPSTANADSFSIEIQAPTKYLELCGETTEREFTHTRYTAVTCSPDDFGTSPTTGQLLRATSLARATELFIVITMYNEDDKLFTKTMSSVMRNIAYLCSTSCPRSWGPNGWTNIVVCVVADGRAKVHPRVLTALSVMGVYPLDQNLPSKIGDKPVSAHIFEFTTQVSIEPDSSRISTYKDGIVPVQILFCLKEKNAKKINSHRWFFNAFAPHLQPNVCVLLDVGTKPTRTSFFHLWKAFDRDPNVGGACGEICAELGRGWTNLLNPLVAAQNFEYKMSNILDKPLESVFGYIQVLPGAFSAYRYRALLNTGSVSIGPLAAYFRGESMHSGEADLFSANMYLAEDRILCFELVAKLHERWILKYVKDAKAETDVPSTLPELVSQRRRWINGSFFAAVHAVTHFAAFFRSGHSLLRKLLFVFQLIYNVINILFSWFSIGNFYLIFYLLFSNVTSSSDLDPFAGYGPYVVHILSYFYMGAMIAQFISAFGNRPQGTKSLYYSILVAFSVIMCFTLFMGGYNLYVAFPKTPDQWRRVGSLLNQPMFRDMAISTMSTYGVYAISSLLFWDPWHMITSVLQYLIILPTYVNVFMIYAFCNLHDISWGTKGDNLAQGATATSHAGSTQSKPTDAKSVPTIQQPQQSSDSSIAAHEPSYHNHLYVTAQNQIRNTITISTSSQTNDASQDSKRDRQVRIDDYFKAYRTRVTLAWIFSNLILILVFSNETISKAIAKGDADLTARGVAPYLAFVFWSVAVLAGIRFLGSLVFLWGYVVDTAIIDTATRSRPFVPANNRVWHHFKPF